MVQGVEKRIKEAARMGFDRIIVPSTYGDGKGKGRRKGGEGFHKSRDIEVIECGNILDAVNEGLVRKLPKREDKRARVKFGDGGGGRTNIEGVGQLKLDDDDDEIIDNEYD